MPIKRAGKRFDILEMAEEIRRSKPRPQYQSGALDLWNS